MACPPRAKRMRDDPAAEWAMMAGGQYMIARPTPIYAKEATLGALMRDLLLTGASIPALSVENHLIAPALGQKEERDAVLDARDFALGLKRMNTSSLMLLAVRGGEEGMMRLAHALAAHANTIEEVAIDGGESAEYDDSCIHPLLRLLEGVASMRSVRHLTIGNICFSADDDDLPHEQQFFSTATDALARIGPQLESLKINGNHDLYWPGIACTLKCMTALTSLNVEQDYNSENCYVLLEDEEEDNVACDLMAMTRLTSLRVDYMFSTPFKAAEALSGLPWLHSLTLARHNFTDLEDAKALGAGLAGMSLLTSLSMIDNDMDDEAAAAAISRSATRLVSLSITREPRVKFAEPLCVALGGLTRLTTLDVSQCGIAGDDDMENVATTVGSLRFLRKLFFDGNPAGQEALEARLAPVISKLFFGECRMPIREFTNLKKCVEFVYTNHGPNAVAKLSVGGDAGNVNEKLVEKIQEYMKSGDFIQLCNRDEDSPKTISATCNPIVDDESGEVQFEVQTTSEENEHGMFDLYVQPPNTAGGAHTFYSMWEDAEGWHTPSLDDRDHGKDTKCGSLICGRCGGVCL